MADEIKDPLLINAVAVITAMQRYEQNLEEKTQVIAHLKQQKSILEDNIQLLYEKLEEINNQKSGLRAKKEKLRQTIAQIETFKKRMEESFESILTNIKKDKDIFED